MRSNQVEGQLIILYFLTVTKGWLREGINDMRWANRKIPKGGRDAIMRWEILGFFLGNVN